MNLVSVIQKVLKQKRFLLFLLKLGVLFLVYYVWFKPNAWTLPVIHTYYEYFIHYSLKFVMEPSVSILQSLGHNAQLVDQREIHVMDNNFRFLMLNPCLGVDMIFAFAALVVSYPGRWIHKLWFIPLGYVVIEMLNIARVTALCLVWLKYGTGGPIDHHDLFNLAMVIAILVLFLFWVRKPIFRG